MTPHTLVAALLISLACRAASAQFFSPMGGPEGGWISNLSRDPASGAIFAGVNYQWGYNKTAGSVHKSTDNGETWAELSAAVAGVPAQNTALRGLAVSPTGTLYVATRGAGLRQSTDGGASFTAMASAGLPNQMLLSIALDSDGSIYAAVEQGGIYRLSPGGAAWTASNTGLPNLVVRAVLISGAWQFAGTTTGLYRRTASGAWIAPASGVGSIGVNTFAIGAGTLYACCDNGLWTSSDGGDHWSQVSGPFSGLFTYGASETSSGILVGSQAGFHRRLASGAWESVGGVGTSLIPRCFLNDPGVLLAGTAGSGVFGSQDLGATWQPSNSGLVAHTVLRLSATSAGSILAGTRVGIHRFSGGSWDPAKLSDRTIFALTQSPWGEVYAGNYNIINGVSDGHAFVSNDDGQSWAQLDINASPAMVSGFAFVPETHEVYCSVAWNAGAVRKRSLDQLSWSAAGPTDNPPAYFMGRSAGGDLYIGSEGEGVRRLGAGQSQWINLGFSSSQQFAIAFNSAGDVFFGNDGTLRGVYRSTDGGMTFQPLNGYPSLFGHAIVIAPSGTVFAAGRDMGVWRSDDNGDTWQDMSGGLATTSVLSLAIGIDGHLYAGSAGHGVYRSDAPVHDVCEADLDGDRVVGGSDLTAMFAQWGPTKPGSGADLDHNGTVDGADLVFILSAWGACGG